MDRVLLSGLGEPCVLHAEMASRRKPLERICRRFRLRCYPRRNEFLRISRRQSFRVLYRRAFQRSCAFKNENRNKREMALDPYHREHTYWGAFGFSHIFRGCLLYRRVSMGTFRFVGFNKLSFQVLHRNLDDAHHLFGSSKIKKT